LAQTQTENEALRNKNESFKERLDALRARNRQLENDQQFWQNSLTSVHEVEADLRKQLSLKISATESLKKENAEKEVSRLKILEDLSLKQDLLDHQKSKLEALQKTVVEYKMAICDLEDRVSSAEANCLEEAEKLGMCKNELRAKEINMEKLRRGLLFRAYNWNRLRHGGAVRNFSSADGAFSIFF